MIYEIKNRFTGAVIYTAEIECDEHASDAVKLRLAVIAAYLSEADLSGANLCEANLRGAYLCGANLCGANLCEANLCGANLRGANLYEANLCGANLCGANLRGTDLSGANLCGTDLSGANLCGADLRAYGDMTYLRTLQIGTWAIGYTHDTLQIGCQRHAIDKWRRWDTDAGRKWVSTMDAAALEWANRNLTLVLAIIDANPALVPDLGKAGE